MAVRERIIFSENRDRRSVTLAELGAKGGLKAAHASFHFESQLAHGARQQVRREMLLELGFRMFVDLMTEAGDDFAVRIDCTGYFRMSIHRHASSRFICLLASSSSLHGKLHPCAYGVGKQPKPVEGECLRGIGRLSGLDLLSGRFGPVVPAGP